VSPCGRRHIDYGSAARRFQQRYGVMSAQELAGETNIERAAPIGGRDLLNAARRPGDACIVDQRIEAAEGSPGFGEQPLDVGFASDIRLRSASLPVRGKKVGKEIVGHVADKNLGAAR